MLHAFSRKFGTYRPPHVEAARTASTKGGLRILTDLQIRLEDGPKKSGESARCSASIKDVRRTVFILILISFSRNVVNDQCFTHLTATRRTMS